MPPYETLSSPSLLRRLVAYNVHVRSGSLDDSKLVNKVLMTSGSLYTIMVHPQRCLRSVFHAIALLLLVLTLLKMLLILTAWQLLWPVDTQDFKPLSPNRYLTSRISLEDKRCSTHRLSSTMQTSDIICQHNNSMPATELTLFTTMTYRRDKLQTFINTLRLWPQLTRARLVLFLAPSTDNTSSDYIPRLEEVASLACQFGWNVLVAPRCNKHNYPVLSTMFLVAEDLWQSTWYGYSNADIMYTQDLINTLDILERYRGIHANFLTGRRRNVQVGHGICDFVSEYT